MARDVVKEMIALSQMNDLPASVLAGWIESLTPDEEAQIHAFIDDLLGKFEDIGKTFGLDLIGQLRK